MKYVNMNEAAFDLTDIVFPGLGNCHGVVYITTQGLYGFHIFGNPADSKARAEMWGSFVKGHRLGGNAVGVALVGACPSNRYGNVASEQRAELQLFANAVGFTGPISGVTWNIQALGWGTTYCAISVSPQATPPVTVRIEDFTGQDAQNVMGANPSPSDQKTIYIQKQNAMAGAPVDFSSCKNLSSVITGVTRKGTQSQLVQLLPL